MHMADALLSPAVGAAFWAASATALAASSRAVRAREDERLVPLMGVLGAFVFAAQMINFALPGTGSSGHLGGGLLLAILLGAPAAFVVIASVLTVQALFFADGGLLALGANVFNLGVFPCFVAYPLVWLALVGRDASRASRARIVTAALLAALLALLLGALAVVGQTTASGIAALPFDAFAALMLPVHAGIGVVEGLATAAIVLFVQRTRPDLLRPARAAADAAPARTWRPAFAGFAIAALVTGGLLSGFASSLPDGLEWSVAHAATREFSAPADGAHALLAQVQGAVAVLPDYALPGMAEEPAGAAGAARAVTSLAGVTGACATLLLVAGIGWLLRRTRR